jgi:hypothetical protein
MRSTTYRTFEQSYVLRSPSEMGDESKSACGGVFGGHSIRIIML